MTKPKSPKYKEIETSIIRKSPLHWTRVFDPDKFEVLCNSIEDAGVRVPISVRPKTEGKGYEYITGDRRFQAVKQLKMKTIPCLIKEMDDLDARQESICENLGREDFTPAVEDEALRELVEIKKKQLMRDRRDTPDPDRSKSGKRGQPEKLENEAIKAVAAQQGCSTRTVMRAVALDKLIPDAAAAYKDEKISKRQAELLAKMDEEEQDEELQVMLNETQEETEERLQAAKKRKAPPLPPGDSGTHNVNPAIWLFDRITVLSRDLRDYAKKLRGELTEESVAALKDLNKSDIVTCHQALSHLLGDIDEVAAWQPHSRK